MAPHKWGKTWLTTRTRQRVCYRWPAKNHMRLVWLLYYSSPQIRGQMVAGPSFPSCSPSAAVSFRVSSRQRRAGRSQKESCKNLMLSAHAMAHTGDASSARRNTGVVFPHCKVRWAFVTPIPDGAARRSPFVWRQAATAGWARPSLMVGLELHIPELFFAPLLWGAVLPMSCI